MTDLDRIAWGFLRSEFTGRAYAGWTIERRIDAYLVRRGLRRIADDGAACGRLLERVMSNIGRARRRGLFPAPS
ncbi:hypothetical protein [Mycolicibacterium thermoresistibile]